MPGLEGRPPPSGAASHASGSSIVELASRPVLWASREVLRFIRVFALGYSPAGAAVLLAPAFAGAPGFGNILSTRGTLAGLLALLVSAGALAAPEPQAPVQQLQTQASPTAPTPTPTSTPVQPPPAPQPVVRASDPPPDTSIDRHRTPFEVLNERLLGSACRAVRYDWRRAKFGFGAEVGQVLELNNFVSTRVGAFVRVPFGSLLGELGVVRVFTSGTDSSDKLGLTPYRQAGRPSRFELDVNLAFPVAEGVATASPGFFPATELVLSGVAGLRYRYYDGELSGMTFADSLRALVSPTLSAQELASLEGSRLPGMQIDGGRYGLVLGGTLDIYFQAGFVVTPRLMVSPFSWSFTSPGLGWWWELTLDLGMMIK